MKTLSKNLCFFLLLPIYTSFSVWFIHFLEWKYVFGIPETLKITVLIFLISVHAYSNGHVTLNATIILWYFAFILNLTSTVYVFLFICNFINIIIISRIIKYIKKNHCTKEKPRSGVQICCNVGFSVLVILFQLHIIGSKHNQKVSDETIYFYHKSNLAALGSLSCAISDTFASDITKLIPHKPRIIIKPWKKVPPGTHGGVSIPGFIFSLIGGFLVGLLYYIGLRLFPNSLEKLLAYSFKSIVINCTILGFLGSMIDSFLGAVFQFTGIDKHNNTIVDYNDTHIRPISGMDVLDNETVNLISTVLTGVIATRKQSL